MWTPAIKNILPVLPCPPALSQLQPSPLSYPGGRSLPSLGSWARLGSALQRGAASASQLWAPPEPGQGGRAVAQKPLILWAPQLGPSAWALAVGPRWEAAETSGEEGSQIRLSQ